MEIKIEPLDTLFFRDGKPFEKGENTWADGMMLPNPTVIYGALRTAFAVGNDIAFKDIFIKGNEERKDKGEYLSPKDFSIKRIYYYVKDAEVLPLPLDYVEHQKGSNIKEAEEDAKLYEVHQLQVKKIDRKIINSKLKDDNHYLLPEDKSQVDEFPNGLMDVSQLETYLSNELITTEAYKLSDFIQSESKIGIGRENATRVSEDGNLFRVDMQRSEDFQIGVAVKTDYDEFSDVIKIGGETKTANLYLDEDSFFGIYDEINFENNRFKIYFSSPTILINGKPDLSILEIEADLITAVVGKPIHIGGFDMVNKRPKTMYKVIPAGSVFYYQAKDDVSLLNEKQGISLSDKLSEQGFGTCYFGTWNITE